MNDVHANTEAGESPGFSGIGLARLGPDGRRAAWKTFKEPRLGK